MCLASMCYIKINIMVSVWFILDKILLFFTVCLQVAIKKVEDAEKVAVLKKNTRHVKISAQHNKCALKNNNESTGRGSGIGDIKPNTKTLKTVTWQNR